MSIVSGIVVCMSCCEDDARIAEINAWVVGRGFSPMNSIEDEMCTGKHPQMNVLGAGYNYFGSHEDAFGEFLCALEWEMPECVVVIIQPEDGRTKVFRPSAKQEDDCDARNRARFAAERANPPPLPMAMKCPPGFLCIHEPKCPGTI